MTISNEADWTVTYRGVLYTRCGLSVLIRTDFI